MSGAPSTASEAIEPASIPASKPRSSAMRAEIGSIDRRRMDAAPAVEHGAKPLASIGPVHGACPLPCVVPMHVF